jgi:hypothetical protein
MTMIAPSPRAMSSTCPDSDAHVANESPRPCRRKRTGQRRDVSVE